MDLFKNCETPLDVLSGLLDYVGSMVIGFIPGCVKGVLILAAGWYVAKLARAIIGQAGRRLKWEPAIAEYLANTCRYMLFAVFVVSGLRAMGFPITSLLTAMGISGIIIGMGLRAQISNYFAGVMMLAARPFRQGDLIEFGPPPQIGVVREVCMTYTALDSLDNVRIVCPNAVLWRNRIFNFSVHPQRAIRITLKLPFETDVAWAREIATDVLQQHASVADEPAPLFHTAEVAQDHVKALLMAWSNVDSMTVFGYVIREMRKQFEAAGLDVTVPADPVDLKREE